MSPLLDFFEFGSVNETDRTEPLYTFDSAIIFGLMDRLTAYSSLFCKFTYDDVFSHNRSIGYRLTRVNQKLMSQSSSDEFINAPGNKINPTVPLNIALEGLLLGGLASDLSLNFNAVQTPFCA